MSPHLDSDSRPWSGEHVPGPADTVVQFLRFEDPPADQVPRQDVSVSPQNHPNFAGLPAPGGAAAASSFAASASQQHQPPTRDDIRLGLACKLAEIAALIDEATERHGPTLKVQAAAQTAPGSNAPPKMPKPARDPAAVASVSAILTAWSRIRTELQKPDVARTLSPRELVDLVFPVPGANWSAFEAYATRVNAFVRAAYMASQAGSPGFVQPGGLKPEPSAVSETAIRQRDRKELCALAGHAGQQVLQLLEALQQWQPEHAHDAAIPDVPILHEPRLRTFNAVNALITRFKDPLTLVDEASAAQKAQLEHLLYEMDGASALTPSHLASLYGVLVGIAGELRRALASKAAPSLQDQPWATTGR